MIRFSAYEFMILLLLPSCKLLMGMSPPILMWGSNAIPTSTGFRPINSSTFAELVEPLQRSHMIIAYFTRNLMAKDFMCRLNDSINSPRCHSYLYKQAPRTFYSHVEVPSRALEIAALTAKHIIWHSISLSDEPWNPQQLMPLCQPGLVHIYNFSKEHEQRQLNLRAHDRFIGALNRQFELQLCPVVQLYTGHENFLQRKNSSRWRRSNIQIKSKPTKLTIFRNKEGIIAFERIVEAVEIRQGSVVSYDRKRVEASGADVYKISDRECEFVLDTDIGNVKMQLLASEGSWIISGATIKGDLYLPRDLVFFDQDYSFCCFVLTVYSKEGNRLSIYSISLDVKINDSKKQQNSKSTKPCWFCEYYFSKAIVQALFPGLIVCAITVIGFALLWDIGRNAHMTDPDGPNLVFYTE